MAGEQISEAGFARADEFLLATLEAVAGEIEPIDGGWIARSPELPLVWIANEVRISRPVEYDEALEIVERAQGEMAFRQLSVDDEPSGARLAPAFQADGWDVRREVVMALERDPDREADTGSVVEATEAEADALVRRWLAEDPGLDETDEGLNQVCDYNRRCWRARNATRLGVRDAQGALVAVTILYSDGVVAQVEDVYVVPEARGAGFGRALVTRALALAREAGHEFTFIIADADGWPRDLYAKLGFEPVGIVHAFHRKAGARGVDRT